MEAGQPSIIQSGISLLFVLIFYLAIVFPIVKIAQKTGHSQRAWWGWIPILNLFLMIQIAGKQWWWFLLCLIPFVGIIPITFIWAGICQARKRNPWLALLTLVPLVNIGFMYYLAFAD